MLMFLQSVSTWKFTNKEGAHKSRADLSMQCSPAVRNVPAEGAVKL